MKYLAILFILFPMLVLAGSPAGKTVSNNYDYCAYRCDGECQASDGKYQCIGKKFPGFKTDTCGNSCLKSDCYGIEGKFYCYPYKTLEDCKNKCSSKCLPQGQLYVCASSLKTTEKDEKRFHDAVLKQHYPLIICNSKTPIDDPNHNPIECVNAKEIRIMSNLMALYNKGWKLNQILKTENGYLYYLDKK